MKFYSILFLLACGLQLHSQSYLNETSTWKQYLRYGGLPGWTFIDDYTLTIDSDTIIQGKTYFRVLKTGTKYSIYTNYHNIPPTTDTTLNVIHEYISPIREENQAFYKYSSFEQKEVLLADFKLSVGDTLYSPSCDETEVIRIDTLYIGDIPRKQFHIPPPGPGDSRLIEGVGSSFGLEYLPCNAFYGVTLMLQCYSLDGKILKVDPSYPCESILTSTHDPEPSEFLVYPNPFLDEFRISFNALANEKVHISIYDFLGRLVYDKQVIWKDEPFPIYSSSFSPGHYFIRLESEKTTILLKAIKV